MAELLSPPRSVECSSDQATSCSPSLRGDEAASVVPPGPMREVSLASVGDDFMDCFQRCDSKDIIYEEPKLQAKILAGRYLKGRLVGIGSYSKVKEVLDCVTLSRRAVKIMTHRRLKKIINGEANVQREIKILKKLKHKNVIELVEVFDDQEKQKLYIVLEYCVGGLQEMLDRAPGNKFPIWQAHRYFVQLINGLEYLHSRGVVHKDIKPGNLLLTSDDIVKITDFGVAEELDQFSQTDLCYTSQGSPAFQPPEIASYLDSWSGFKVDIWASGVTLYNFVTGKLPFDGENEFKLYRVISIGVYVIPSSLPPLLKDIIKGMLNKEPDQRYGIPDIRTHPWFISKHGHPLQQELVRFPPYTDCIDPARGTTVLPYLEAFYQYGGAAENAPRQWSSEEDELFHSPDSRSVPSTSQSLASVNRADRSMDTISGRRSRKSSQENVLFPSSRSVEALQHSPVNTTSQDHKKKRSRNSRPED